MDVQTMSSHGGSGGGGGLSRQGSIYSLTLNEVQSHLGEPLLSMNLDDLLRTVLPAAEPPEPPAMPRALSKKTVDEVWRDIQKIGGGGGGGAAGHGRQPTLGEMTLEDFLSRAGVAVDGAEKNGEHSGSPGGGANVHWLQQYQQAQHGVVGAYVGRPVPRPLGVGAGPILDAMYHDGHGVGFSSPPAVVGGGASSGRKRGAAADGMVEKTVERRQKRMIKNRESAARSRARKQAYTNELENKISRLEEENERLRKRKELESVVHYVPQPEPKHQLRPTNSAPF